MLATTVDALNIPSLWYSAVTQVQAAAEPPNTSYLDRIGRGFHYMLGASSTVSAHVVNLPEIAQLGWSTVEALETHLRFRSFANDWDAPGMEAYDDL
jgi:hypothetical protein